MLRPVGWLVYTPTEVDALTILCRLVTANLY